MLIKGLIVIAFIAIVASLGSAFYFLMTDDARSRRTVHALSWRIGLSILLFLLIILGIATGVIEPNATPLPRSPAA